MQRNFTLTLLASALGLALQIPTASAQTTSAADASRSYWSAKAQCWADLATAEASQGDTHGTAQTAAGNADRIRNTLSQGTDPTASTEEPIFSERFLPSTDPRHGRPSWRADIELIDAVLGRYRARNCRTPKLGCLEVAQASVYENMEETRGARWNHGRPEIDKALALAADATAEFENACVPPPPVPVPTIVEAPKAIPLEVIELPSDTLFRFDMSSESGMLPGAHAAIHSLAVKVRRYGSRAGAVQVVGYTDRLGSRTYNLALSERRAATVGRLLTSGGVTVPLAISGAGPANPITGDACARVRPRQALIDCLQPDRRVVIRIMPPTP